VLSDAGRDVPATVHGEVGAPRKREVEPNERGLLVPELRVPELERRDGCGVANSELAHLQHSRPRGRLLCCQRRLVLLLGLKLLLAQARVDHGRGIVDGRAVTLLRCPEIQASVIVNRCTRW